MKAKTKRAKKGKWVFVPNEDIPEEELLAEKMDKVAGMLSIGVRLAGPDSHFPFAAAEQFHDYFPGDNEVPEGGAWILVKTPPPTEYTVPPLSIWFAEPWPLDSEQYDSHRVKIVTPRGELGLFPREYSRIEDPGRYYEFIGDGMEIHFFGTGDVGVPELPLFYLRSRGIAKKDAISMLIGSIKAHGVCWIESDPSICAHFGKEWPAQYRLATLRTDALSSSP